MTSKAMVPVRRHGALEALGELLALLLGWPSALWSAWRARRRLRAYGPPAVLALRDRGRR